MISSLEIINVVLPDRNIHLWIAVSLNGIKTHLPNGLSTFPIKGNTVFSNGPSDCRIYYNLAFYNFILAEELFAKALRSFKTCVLVDVKLCEKLFSSLESPTTFDEIFKVASVFIFLLFQILIY